MTVLWLVALLPPIFWGIGAQQRLLKLRKYAGSTFEELRTILCQRYALIPHLIEAVRGYLKHERELLESVVALRTQAIQQLEQVRAELGSTNFHALPALLRSEASIRQQLASLVEQIQAQQDAWADPAVQRWLEQLGALLEPLNFAQQTFNHAANRHNAAVIQMPAQLIAWLYRFDTIPLFLPEQIRLPKT